MKLRRGRTRDILESSRDAALLAVEIYNKPRTAFRSEGFITMMVIAWTRLFHAYFNHTIGKKFYYKNKNGRYKRVNGDRRSWELRTCIRKFRDLSEPVKADIIFFIGIRNKIEHRNISKRDVDVSIFGECQALLYNYEKTLIDLFGEDFAINESLVYSLQFSRLRTEEQILANKMVLSSELKDLKEYIDKYRTNLSDEVFNSQEYSIKLIQVPKISNTNRHDLAIEFVNWDQLSRDDRINFDKVLAIIKDKVVKKEAVNVDRLKPGMVLDKVLERTGVKLSHYKHKCFYTVFSVRPPSNDAPDPFDTNPNFCHYDEVHKDYVYQGSWVDFLVSILESDELDVDDVVEYCDDGECLEIEDYIEE